MSEQQLRERAKKAAVELEEVSTVLSCMQNRVCESWEGRLCDAERVPGEIARNMGILADGAFRWAADRLERGVEKLNGEEG